MRLWSIHPKYLDRLGLLAVWREGLLAQKVLLQGEYKECACENGKICVGFSLTERPIYEKCVTCKGTGKIKTPYYNHSQLYRFKEKDIKFIKCYLLEIAKEASKRGYLFNYRKITNNKDITLHNEVYNNTEKLTVTTKQLEYEFKHLQKKLKIRDKIRYKINDVNIRLAISIKKYWRDPIEPHPLFKVIEGEIESWEKVK